MVDNRGAAGSPSIVATRGAKRSEIEGVLKPFSIEPVKNTLQEENFDPFRNFNSAGPLFEPPILDNFHGHGWKDEKGVYKVGIRPCLCQSVWCEICYPKYFLPHIRKKISKFDYRRTRHVVVTVDRELFESPADALEHIRVKKGLAELIKGLKRGLRKKIGKEWVWVYKPVRITKYLWVLEWYEDGFPHWHILIETDTEGYAGMIGGDAIRHFWNYARWCYESYFRNEKHFSKIVCYYAKTGYFEKGKKYQSVLPESIKNTVKGRIRRWAYGFERINYEAKNHKEVCDFFDKIIKEHIDNGFNVSPNTHLNSLPYKPEYETAKKILTQTITSIKNLKNPESKPKRDVDYAAILKRCRSKSLVDLDIMETNIKAVVGVDFDSLRERYGTGCFSADRGYILNLNFEELTFLLSNTERVTSISGYLDIDDWIREREWQIKMKEKYGPLVSRMKMVGKMKYPGPRNGGLEPGPELRGQAPAHRA